MKFLKSFVILAILLSSNAFAAKSESGPYLGFGIGDTITDDGGLGKKATGYEVTAQEGGFNSTYRVVGGYQLNPLLSIEAEYTKHDDISFQIAGKSAYTAQFNSLMFSGNVGYTFVPRYTIMGLAFRPHASAGLGKIDWTIKGTGQYAQSSSSSAVGFRLGVGLDLLSPAFDRWVTRIGYVADITEVELLSPIKKASSTYTLKSYFVSSIYKF